MATDDGKVLELVVFKLRPGASRGSCIASLDERARRRSMQEAQAAAERAMTSQSCAPMFGLIDMESTLMLHGERVHAA